MLNLQWLLVNAQPLINSLGIIFDILGTWLVAWGMVRTYKESRYKHTFIHKSVIPAGIAGIQTAWIARSLPSLALDTRFPAGMTTFVYKGMRYKASADFAINDLVAGQDTADTKALQNWKRNQYNKMKIGFAFLTFGFALQLISNWIQ